MFIDQSGQESNRAFVTDSVSSLVRGRYRRKRFAASSEKRNAATRKPMVPGEAHGARGVKGPCDEALAIAQSYEDEIRLVVTDLVMPLMGGREFAERLSALRPETRVLFMSGYTDDAVARHGIMDREMAFLQKPFTAASLVRKVAEVLQEREAKE